MVQSANKPASGGKEKPVRVRYAPSPTGEPHVGNIRTALFTWLFARHTGGRFILRIEDTDVARRAEGALEAILESLRWLGLDWDEGPEAFAPSGSAEPSGQGVGGPYGPYVQSQRLPLYHEVIQGLLAQGDAYQCYCSPQRLEEMRKEQMQKRLPPKYDRACRDLTAVERAEREAQGITPVMRFKTPLEGRTTFQDIIHGEVTVENSTLDDLVLLKSDGYPTYHLANVVDDHLMEISHVVRGDEWLPSTPRHILLYGALGYEPPIFAHLPLILGPDRAKLSKRHGASAITEYREMGYLPETLVNFLALLGWSLDDHTELFSRGDLVRHFTLERIGKTAAVFNRDKLDWMNGVYIRSLSPEALTELLMPFLEKSASVPPEAEPISIEYVRRIVPLIQERLKLLGEAPALTEFFFTQELNYDPVLLLGKDMTREKGVEALKAALGGLEGLEDFGASSLEGLLRPMAQELGLKTGQFFGLLRVATTGLTAAPPLFQTMEVLGRERCLKRINAALFALSSGH